MISAIRDGTTLLGKDDVVQLYIFDIIKEKSNIFGHNGFQSAKMIIELIPEWNLWQATVITEEAFNSDGQPDDVFLIENVE